METIDCVRPEVKPTPEPPPAWAASCTPEEAAQAVRAFEEQRERERAVRMRWAFAEQEAVRRIAAGWRF